MKEVPAVTNDSLLEELLFYHSGPQPPREADILTQDYSELERIKVLGIVAAFQSARERAGTGIVELRAMGRIVRISGDMILGDTDTGATILAGTHFTDDNKVLVSCNIWDASKDPISNVPVKAIFGEQGAGYGITNALGSVAFTYPHEAVRQLPITLQVRGSC
jgi:hypothetical protein